MKVLVTNKLDVPIDASPALVGKEIILRSKTHLYGSANDGGFTGAALECPGGDGV